MEADGDWEERSAKSLSEVGSAGAKPEKRRLEKGSCCRAKEKAKTGALQVAGLGTPARQASMEAEG